MLRDSFVAVADVKLAEALRAAMVAAGDTGGLIDLLTSAFERDDVDRELSLQLIRLAATVANEDDGDDQAAYGLWRR